MCFNVHLKSQYLFKIIIYDCIGYVLNRSRPDQISDNSTYDLGRAKSRTQFACNQSTEYTVDNAMVEVYVIIRIRYVLYSAINPITLKKKNEEYT